MRCSIAVALTKMSWDEQRVLARVIDCGSDCVSEAFRDCEDEKKIRAVGVGEQPPWLVAIAACAGAGAPLLSRGRGPSRQVW